MIGSMNIKLNIFEAVRRYLIRNNIIITFKEGATIYIPFKHGKTKEKLLDRII